MDQVYGTCVSFLANYAVDPVAGFTLAATGKEGYVEYDF
jgi:hypothetical protein